MIPATIALLLFDHSMLSKSDILKSVGGNWFWAGMILMYSACFYSLYKLSTTLVHPIIFKTFKVPINKTDDDWVSVIVQTFIWSALAIFITWLKRGNIIHFIGNSFIVAAIVNSFGLLSYTILYLMQPIYKRVFP